MCFPKLVMLCEKYHVLKSETFSRFPFFNRKSLISLLIHLPNIIIGIVMKNNRTINNLNDISFSNFYSFKTQNSKKTS